MLIKVLRSYLKPYKVPIAIVVLLQLVSTIATLYLPTLNADIIDKGVITGDTGYICAIGGVMLAVTSVQVVASVVAVYFGARAAMGFGRDVRGRRSSTGEGLLRPGGRPLRRAVADHPYYQRRAAGPDAHR